MRALPVRRPELAGLVADVALAASAGRGPVRVGVDGLAPGAGEVADELAAALADRGVQALRATAGDFLRARSLRLEYGAPTAEDLQDGWFDDEALARLLLGPLAPGGDRRVVTGLRHPDTDRSLRLPWQELGAAAVLVLDGPLLGRPGLEGLLDLQVHLALGAAALERATAPDARPIPGAVTGEEAARAYRESPSPQTALRVAFDHPARPAVLLPDGWDALRAGLPEPRRLAEHLLSAARA
ncbi:MAG: hypothetical protein U0Q15_10595 [Kineosporiaceae bacterium]